MTSYDTTVANSNHKIFYTFFCVRLFPPHTLEKVPPPVYNIHSFCSCVIVPLARPMLRYDTIVDLSVKCRARHSKIGTFIRNHQTY